MNTKKVKRDECDKRTVELHIAGHPVTLSFAAEPDATVAQRVRSCLITPTFVRMAWDTALRN